MYLYRSDWDQIRRTHNLSAYEDGLFVYMPAYARMLDLIQANPRFKLWTRIHIKFLLSSRTAKICRTKSTGCQS